MNDLKKGIEAFFMSKKAREQFPETTQIINWKYIWKKFSLMYKEENLVDINRSLRDYGIVNRSELVFVKKVLRKI